VIGIGLLGHLADPGVGLDPLWAKNITYFFGHSIANIAIYLAAGMIYAILPRYAHREWPTTRPVVLAWLAILILVLPAYFHHLYMDFVQPLALDVAGEGITYAAVTGSLVVTIFGALLLVWRSAFRWTLGSVLLYAGLSGWLIGGIAAALDVLIPFNFHLHNTLWVVGHFHNYYLLGIILFLFGFLTHLLEEAAAAESSPRVRVLVPGAILAGGYGLVGIWLLAGLLSLPRRYAVQPPGGETLARVAVAAVLILLVGLLGLLAEWWRLIAAARRRQRAVRAGLRPLDEMLLRRAGFHRVT
jgi:cytochrome c oxidase subunit 1